MLLNQRFGVSLCKKERVQTLQKKHFKTGKDQRNVYQGKRSKNIKS